MWVHGGYLITYLCRGFQLKTTMAAEKLFIFVTASCDWKQIDTGVRVVSAHNFQKESVCVSLSSHVCQGAGWVCARCGAIQLNSIIYWHIKLKLRMVLQNDVILKALRFEKPSVKIIFDLLTQRYCGNVDIYINTLLSAILYCISYSMSPYVKTCILHICN